MSDMIEELRTLDLDDEEAEVYLRLLQVGPSKVGDLASLVPVGRSKLYRLLDGLAQRGVVTKGLERPTIYRSEPPEEVFQASLRELERRRGAIEEAQARIVDALGDLEDRPVEQPVNQWHVLEGSSAIYRGVQDLVEDARKEVWVVSNRAIPDDEHRAAEDAGRMVRHRAKDGIHVRLLSGPGDEETLFPHAVDRDGIEVRQADTDEQLAFAVADGSDLLAWVRWRPEGVADSEDVALRTDTPAMVEAYVLLFTQLWDATT